MDKKQKLEMIRLLRKGKSFARACREMMDDYGEPVTFIREATKLIDELKLDIELEKIFNNDRPTR